MSRGATAANVLIGIGTAVGEDRFEAVYVAEVCDGEIRPAGEVRFGIAGKGLWPALDQLRAGSSRRDIVPVRPVLVAEVKHFGRIGGWIRDGVLLSVSIAPDLPNAGRLLGG